MSDPLLSPVPNVSNGKGHSGRSSAIRNADFDLYQTVRGRLQELRLQFRCDVTAQVHRGRVELTGEVDSTEHRVRVICTISRVFGIHEVHDFISINPLARKSIRCLSGEHHGK